MHRFCILSLYLWYILSYILYLYLLMYTFEVCSFKDSHVFRCHWFSFVSCKNACRRCDIPIGANIVYWNKKKVWERGKKINKICQSKHRGRGSFLSLLLPQMLSLSLLLLLSLNDSDMNIFSQECSDRRCVCVRSCMRVCLWYDRGPLSNCSSLLRLVDFFTSSGSWVHLQEQNCYLQMWPLHLENH